MLALKMPSNDKHDEDELQQMWKLLVHERLNTYITQFGAFFGHLEELWAAAVVRETQVWRIASAVLGFLNKNNFAAT
jgi:hypothetical protein